MNDLLVSVASFLVAVGVLVTVHEFGHFWVARRLGVKVLRFSIGFGKPLWSRRFGDDDTELVVAALPLGGYVKMLDEREGEVPEKELRRAFNRQPLATRSAIVLAGPLFNFLFAILAYWLMFVSGVPGIRPVVGEVEAGSYAEEAGFRRGDEILAIEAMKTPTWETTVIFMLDAALDQRSVQVTVRGENGRERLLWLDLNNTTALLEKGGLLKNLGITPWRPAVPAVVGRLVTGGAAERAGLQPGDRILEADGIVIADWEQWVDFVRSRPEHDISLEVERGGRTIHLQLRPDRIEEDGEAVGRIGTFVATPDKHLNDHMRTTVRYGVFDALEASLGKTWDMTTLTLRTLWKMVRGQASVENLSGPISIARYAGQSAMVGLTAFLGFMALVSVSLGVLNLLPVPVLDGGHLLYYLIEFFKGSPVSETTQQIGQQIGIALLICLMALAFYNDIARLTG